MRIVIRDTKLETGREAARKGAELISRAISRKGKSNIIVATGASQFDMLDELTLAEIEWARVSAFHLDEYIGIEATHPASFRKYLKERFVDHVPLKDFHYIDGNADPRAECARLAQLIGQHPIDVAFIGIGENAHLAFNDPPADLKTKDPYIVVNLDHACRMQQYTEGWFDSVEDVPGTAISMSIHHILRSEAIICTVPDERKSTAVMKTIAGPVSPQVPASVLNGHGQTWLYLDKGSSSLLKGDGS